MAVTIDIGKLSPELREIERQLERVDTRVYRNVKANAERAVGRAAVDPIRSEYDQALASKPFSRTTGRPLRRTGETRRRIGVWTRSRRGNRTVRVGGRNFGSVAVVLGISGAGRVEAERPFVERGVESVAPQLTRVAVEAAQKSLDREIGKLNKPKDTRQ